jgi:hypothetical protein
LPVPASSEFDPIGCPYFSRLEPASLPDTKPSNDVYVGTSEIFQIILRKFLTAKAGSSRRDDLGGTPQGAAQRAVPTSIIHHVHNSTLFYPQITRIRADSAEAGVTDSFFNIFRAKMRRWRRKKLCFCIGRLRGFTPDGRGIAAR